MSLLTRIGVRAGAGLARTRLGETTVVHDADGVTAEAGALAESLPADPDHELVVADLPPVSPIEVWKAFAAALPRGRRPVRVVPGRQPREVAPHVWQWLADRTNRTVVAPYGMTHHLGNALFVHSADQSGWVEFRRGRGPAWRGKRFPRPAWDSVEFGRVRAAGFRGVAEPLPAGMWVRPDIGDGALTTGRTRLRALPCQPDAPLLVLGARDAADLEPADIAAFCRTLPTAPRFVLYGGVAVTNSAVGQELADLLGVELCCYNGIPADPPDVLTLRTDGSLGWNTFAQAFTYRPGGGARLTVHRPPVDGLGEVSPGVYWYTRDVVLEVVRAGLWIRPAEQIADPAGVRNAPLDPVHNLLLYEATEPAAAELLREVAEGLVNRLDDATRVATRLMPSTALAGVDLAAVTRTTERARPPAEPTPVPASTPQAPPPSAPTTVLNSAPSLEIPSSPEPTAALNPASPLEVPPPPAPTAVLKSAPPLEIPPRSEPTTVLESAPPLEDPLPPEPTVALKPAPPLEAEPVPEPVPPPAPVPEEPVATEEDLEEEDLTETDLPWLSRLMETMSMPVPVRPSEVERHDDRGSR
ncbi:hypothetical protein [Actinophytocola sp.]|uniref:hypothetical protein n=1 Tax=Actinophytocola sp. TaxID=1872138 RepID=UPI00389B01DD